MIARIHRFHGFNALRHVYSRGQTVRCPLLAIKYLARAASNPTNSTDPSGSQSPYRAAVVVSRKVHKSAVVRNRIRRRIYEIIRRSESGMTAAYDIVVTVFSDQTATMDAAGLEAMVTEQLARARIVRPARPDARLGTHVIVERTKEIR